MLLAAKTAVLIMDLQMGKYGITGEENVFRHGSFWMALFSFFSRLQNNLRASTEATFL